MQNMPISPQVQPQQYKKPSIISTLLFSVAQTAGTFATGGAVGGAAGFAASKLTPTGKGRIMAQLADIVELEAKNGNTIVAEQCLKNKDIFFKEAKKYAKSLKTKQFVGVAIGLGALGFALYKMFKNFLPEKPPLQQAPELKTTQG